MKTKELSFWIWMAVVWIWPLVLLLSTFRWYLPCEGLRLLCKSTWVLYAGELQGWIVVQSHIRRDRHPDPRVVVFLLLSTASWLLLPYGLGRWEYDYSGGYGLVPDWNYIDNLFLSFFLHLPTLAVMLWGFMGYGGLGSLGGLGGSIPDVPYKREVPAGWLDGVWKGGQVSDDFLGHRGEFDLNDEARRASEDMQQFHYSHPDADLSDHYYWEDVLDADTDGYLEDA